MTRTRLTNVVPVNKGELTSILDQTKICIIFQIRHYGFMTLVSINALINESHFQERLVASYRFIGAGHINNNNILRAFTNMLLASI